MCGLLWWSGLFSGQCGECGQQPGQQLLSTYRAGAENSLNGRGLNNVRVVKSSDTLLCQNWWLATLLLLSSKTLTCYAILTGNDNALPVTRTPLLFLYKTDPWTFLCNLGTENIEIFNL